MNTLRPSISFSPRPRRDGKFQVSLFFPGAPNAFGGFYPSRNYRKLYTLERLLESVAIYGTSEQKAWAATVAPKS
jgi:hypothetical protein